MPNIMEYGVTARPDKMCPQLLLSLTDLASMLLVQNLFPPVLNDIVFDNFLKAIFIAQAKC